MRLALNNNPVVQLGVHGGLALIVAVFFMMNSKGGGSSDSGSTASSSATSTQPAYSAQAPAGTASASSAGAAAAPSSGAAETPSLSTTSGSVSPQALVPGPGLPAEQVLRGAPGGR